MARTATERQAQTDPRASIGERYRDRDDFIGQARAAELMFTTDPLSARDAERLGVVNRVVYARATAERMKRSEQFAKVGPIAATGHGFTLPNEMGEMPQNIVFAVPNGSQTLEQMIASTEHGVLVTRESPNYPGGQ